MNSHCTSPGHPRRVSHPDMAIREGHLQEQARWSTHTLESDIVRHRCLAKLHSAVLHNTTSTLLGATNYKQHVGMLSSEVICHFESNSQLLCWESGRFSRCALLLTLVPLVVSHEVGTRDQVGSWWFLDIQWETSEPKNSKEISFLTTLEMLQFLDVCKITKTKKNELVDVGCLLLTFDTGRFGGSVRFASPELIWRGIKLTKVTYCPSVIMMTSKIQQTLQKQ